jgi:hypothetical protein
MSIVQDCQCRPQCASFLSEVFDYINYAWSRLVLSGCSSTVVVLNPINMGGAIGLPFCWDNCSPPFLFVFISLRLPCRLLLCMLHLPRLVVCRLLLPSLLELTSASLSKLHQHRSKLEVCVHPPCFTHTLHSCVLHLLLVDKLIIIYRHFHTITYSLMHRFET